MPQPFPGLTEADFDAYLPARATSNVYVRPRLGTKQKMLDLGRDLAERARDAGVALDVQASDERPSIWNKKSVTEQWVFLFRDRDARAELERVGGGERPVAAALLDPTPFQRHAFVGLYLDAVRFALVLRIHRDAWADVKTLRRRLESDAGRAALTELLRALPEGYSLGVTDGEAHAARECDAARLGALLDAATASGSWIFVARSMQRPDAVARGPELQGFALETFDALLPLYRTVAWRRDDDPADVDVELAQKRQAREAQAAEATAREAAWQARHNAEIAARRERALLDARERLAALEPARPAAVLAAVASIPAPQPPPGPPRPAPRSEGEGERRGAHPQGASTQGAQAQGGNHGGPRRPEQGGPRADAAPRAGAGQRHDPRGQRAEKQELRGDPRARSGGAPPRDRDEARPRSAPAAQPSESAAPKPPRVNVEWVDSVAPVTQGARVRIQRGPFAGRVGTVVEMDARGQAKVSLGLLNARVESRDLVTLAEKV